MLILVDMVENRLHPHIDGIFINPGTGHVDDAREESATQNIAQLVKDVGLEGITYERDPSKDYGKGRFAYKLHLAEINVEVQMPGWSLERVRFLGEKGQNIMDFPRLYVDDNSWLWKYAVGMVEDAFENPDEE